MTIWDVFKVMVGAQIFFFFSRNSKNDDDDNVTVFFSCKNFNLDVGVMWIIFQR